jgi:ribokinase
MGRIVVVGSYNVGLTVVAPTLPAPGQTVLGHTFDMGPGGKGSNQAIAARRLRADVALVAKVGNDAFGASARDLLQREGLLGPGILRAEAHTGVGLILVDDGGNNMIAVAPGANALLSPEDLDAVPGLFEGASHLLCQLECTPELFMGAAGRARDAGMTTVLNPAPAVPLSDEALSLADVLTPNQTELAVLAGMPVQDEGQAEIAARSLLTHGVGTVVVTLGERGALVVTEGEATLHAARHVRVVDPTGAGDAFNAGLVTGLAAGRPLRDATALGLRAGAFCVTRLGCIDGFATLDELDREVPA